MERIVENHFNRISTAALKKYSAASIAKWITENTFYAGQPYSYHDHEYQERILSETARDVVIRKCSQVGISEASSRQAVALVNVMSPYTVAYTLPTAGFAGTFTKTRIDPIIRGSSALNDNIHKTNDNSEIKQFGDSFLYIKGAASSNAPISIPVDHLIHDEVDFSDQEVLGQYVSRLTHSKHKRTTKISTPTLPNFGIDQAFKSSKRNFMMCRCNHCNHWFIPDYYEHVKIPGYRRDLREINKQTLTTCRWQEAAVHCPSCGLIPSLQPEFREWVCENPDENHIAVGYQVTPFDAPNIIVPSYLVETSTKYDRSQDFVNFNLGLAAQDNEATLTDEDFAGRWLLESPVSSSIYVMGVDVGNVYHFVVGCVDAWGDVHSVHREQVPMGLARKRYWELHAKFRIICTVIDSGPHAETVMALQEADPNLYASVYTRTKTISTHTVVTKETNEDKGEGFVRQVNVNRSRAFDGYMEFLRSNHLSFQVGDDMQLVINHHTSMKRVKTFDNESGELVYTWQKSDGIDHFHHAHLYMWIASKIKTVSGPMVQLPFSAARKFRLKQT